MISEGEKTLAELRSDRMVMRAWNSILGLLYRQQMKQVVVLPDANLESF